MSENLIECGGLKFAIARKAGTKHVRALFEFRSIPGNIIGQGRTEEEAREKLHDFLEWVRSEEASFEAWHKHAWSYARCGDRDLFKRLEAAALKEKA